MKYINKNTEPKEFTDWKNLANDNWQPDYGDIDKDVKEKLFNSLKKEQGGICCYCERKLVHKENGLKDYHIEHLKPKNEKGYPELQLVYENLLCCCQDDTSKGEPLHCGRSKDKWYQDDMVTPLQDNCELRFKYRMLSGDIEPFNDSDDGARITIDKLQLNIPKLSEMRKALIDTFLEDENGEELSLEECQEYINGYLVDKKDNSGEYNEFYTVISYLFGHLLIAEDEEN